VWEDAARLVGRWPQKLMQQESLHLQAKIRNYPDLSVWSSETDIQYNEALRQTELRKL
jgi:hypothetical protein